MNIVFLATPLIVPMIQQVALSNLNSQLNAYVTSLYSKSVDQHEKELDGIQMNRLLHWMNMFFLEKPPGNDEPEIKQAYRQELYNIYKTLESDYKQYEQWRRYNQSLWLIKTYRQKDTNGLARKILSDLVLFHEGMNLFSKC
jgi:hypothetical protein